MAISPGSDTIILQSKQKNQNKPKIRQEGRDTIDVKRIEMLKRELQQLLADKGLTDEKVVELSQEINDLILEYYRTDESDNTKSKQSEQNPHDN